jgi:hypothetical protein
MKFSSGSPSGCHALVAAQGAIRHQAVIGDVSMPQMRPLSTHLGMATRADGTPPQPIPRTAREAMAPGARTHYVEAP